MSEFLNKTILLAAIIDHLKISGSPGASHTIGPTFTECIVFIRLQPDDNDAFSLSSSMLLYNLLWKKNIDPNAH